MRKGDWKLVKYNMNAKPVRPFELYNLKDDPGEEKNLSQVHPEILDELKILMANARTDSEVFQFSSGDYDAGKQ